MKILETEIDFDFNDADDMEKLENAIETTQKVFDTMQIEGKKTSEVIRQTCKAVFDCFNVAFGEGTDKKVFGEKTNLNLCLKAFKDLCDAKIEQEDGLEKEMQSIESKYSPNRATRRADQ